MCGRLVVAEGTNWICYLRVNAFISVSQWFTQESTDASGVEATPTGQSPVRS